MQRRLKSRAFTLIELLVVVAIIGLLVSILLPSFNAVRTNAKITLTKAQFSSLATGLNLFRGEQSLGGSLPPSGSDNPDDFMLIANPQKFTGGNGANDPVRIAGAHLLFQAMVGADLLGTPGFRDLDRDGEWWNDTHNDKEGIYEIDLTTGKEKAVRYGGGGYVDDKMRSSAKSLGDLEADGSIESLSDVSDAATDELMFIDPWGGPILYYRANPSLVQMISDPGRGTSGIYRQQDNAIITGSTEGTPTFVGFDFGPGKVNGQYHAIANSEAPVPGVETERDVGDDSTQYEDSFARFIIDHLARARPTPVRKDSYLMISAGPDNRYGTDDDVTNWDRKKHE